MFLLSSYILDWNVHFAFSSQLGPEYVPSQLSESQLLVFSFSRPTLLPMLGAAIRYGRTTSGLTFFPKQLPNSALDGVVKPTDRAVRNRENYYHQIKQTKL